jgi:hypothetical protein
MKGDFTVDSGVNRRAGGQSGSQPSAKRSSGRPDVQ